MRRYLIAVSFTASVFAGLLASSHTHAGDDVDYSAPYVTLENGELVTKYPAREHVAGAQPTDAAGADSATLAEQTTVPNKLWAIAAAAIGAALAVLLLVKRRQQRDPTAE